MAASGNYCLHWRLKISRTMKYTFLGHLLVSILGFAMALAISKFLFVKPAYAPSYIQLPTVEETIKKAKNALVIAKLAQCESSNNHEIINPHDSGSPSYGLLQWKNSSFFYYNNKYKVLPDLEE